MNTICEEVQTFMRWNNVPDGYATKTLLNKEHKLKPFDEGKPDAYVRAQYNSKWNTYNLYLIDNCIPIKQIKTNVDHLPMTDENLAQALYMINKSAKKSRDTKSFNYYRGKHGIVSASKTRQMKLYDLKDNVISKLKGENRINVVGYHVQENDWGKNHLLLLGLSGYTFHVPVDQSQAEQHASLGKIDVIPSEQTKKTKIKFNEAVKILEKYIESEELNEHHPIATQI